MRITLDWIQVDDEHDALDWNRALYAIATPSEHEIVYVGKADGCTVRARLARKGSKKAFWSWYERDCDSRHHVCFVARILKHEPINITRQLLADLESLLIYALKPQGNIQSMKTRKTWRVELEVVCTGDWPDRRRMFKDGETPRVIVPRRST